MINHSTLISAPLRLILIAFAFAISADGSRSFAAATHRMPLSGISQASRVAIVTIQRLTPSDPPVISAGNLQILRII